MPNSPVIPGIGNGRFPTNWPAGEVFAYVLTTVNSIGGRLQQSGSGPNADGGRLTLATCMHYHRTLWTSMKGRWVAGFCSKNVGQGNALFYLMYVAEEFDSQLALWNGLSTAVRNAKNARFNLLGDVYEPKTATAATRYAPQTYYSPHANHSHAVSNGWHDDIDYKGCGGRRPKLLVGDPHYSFVWRAPRYYYRGFKHPRFVTYASLAQYLRQLK